MNMIINKKVISKLRPCKDRFDNYLKYYANKNHTLAQFMGLKNITHADKIWVAFRIMPKDNVHLAAADIAQSVLHIFERALHIFERAYPNDLRPRQAIEAARSGNRDLVRAAAHQATAAANAAHRADAFAAAHAAFAAAYAATHKAFADDDSAYATYSAATYAAATAAAATSAAYNKSEQEKLIRKICLKYLK